MVYTLGSYPCCSNNASCASESSRLTAACPTHVQRHVVATVIRRRCVALPISCRQPRRLSARQSLQARAGLLSFFLPTKQTDKSTQAALVNDLLRLASQTNSGANASQEQRQDIQNLVRNMPVGTAGTCSPAAGFELMVMVQHVLG